MRAIRFLHIPKTAGSTLSSILQRQYFGSRIFALSGHAQADKINFSSRSEQYRNSVRLFLGHAPIYTGIAKADDAVIITILRDPISQVKSFCQHAFEGKSEYLLNDFPPENFDLDKFLASGDIHLANLQTRFLVGNQGFDALPEQEAITTALDNLFHKVSYYGLQEYFDESLTLFSSALNWRLPTYLRKNQKNQKNQLHFSEQHLQRIAAMNALDIAVYQQAKAHFLKQINNDLFDRSRLQKLQHWNHYGYAVILLEYKTIDFVLRFLAKIKAFYETSV